MNWPTSEWVANRTAALHAYLNGEPDGIAWLESTGLTRPHQRQDTAGTWTVCNCPFCEQRTPTSQGGQIP